MIHQVSFMIPALKCFFTAGRVPEILTIGLQCLQNVKIVPILWLKLSLINFT
jgi:hypothetical protein